MIEQICAEINNYFVSTRHIGQYAIVGGSIDLPFLVPGQYFCIRGSRLNNGVHQYPAVDMIDETFDGEILEMRLDAAFTALANEIGAWLDKYGDSINSPYQSESFGGYSYRKATFRTNSDYSDTAWSWQQQFASRLKPYRKTNLDLGLVPVVYH